MNDMYEGKVDGELTAMRKWRNVFLTYLLTFLLAGCGKGAADQAGISYGADGNGIVVSEQSEGGGQADGTVSDGEERTGTVGGAVNGEVDGTSANDLSEAEGSAGESQSGEETGTGQETYTESKNEEDEAQDGTETETGQEPNAESESGDDTAPAESDSGAEVPAETLPEDGIYTSKEDVALYIHLYEHLPSNFITKKEAEKLGWQGGSLEPYAPDKCIGGNRFGNYEGLLPEKEGRTYTECDIDTLGADKRGAKRIVFSNDGLIYYTEDHYESFELLYGEE